MIASNTASTAFEASYLERSACSATALIKSVLFIRLTSSQRVSNYIKLHIVEFIQLQLNHNLHEMIILHRLLVLLVFNSQTGTLASKLYKAYIL